MKYLIIILLSFIFLSGCASTGSNHVYKITYNTVPEGASVICDGVNKGYSPVVLSYYPNESERVSGSMQTKPCKAVWSSGISRWFNNIWDLNQFPIGVIHTVQRPNVEGYSQDAEFALRVQQMKQQEIQNRLQQQQAASAETQRNLDNINRQVESYRRQVENNMPIRTNTNCRSTYGGLNCRSTSY